MTSWIFPFVQKNKDDHEVTRTKYEPIYIRLELDVTFESKPTVPDPDAMFTKAVSAGAREVVAVEEAYGWRLGRVVDPFGHHCEIGVRWRHSPLNYRWISRTITKSMTLPHSNSK